MLWRQTCAVCTVDGLVDLLVQCPHLQVIDFGQPVKLVHNILGDFLTVKLIQDVLGDPLDFEFLELIEHVFGPACWACPPALPCTPMLQLHLICLHRQGDFFIVGLPFVLRIEVGLNSATILGNLSVISLAIRTP